MLESSWVTHPWVEAGGGRPRFALHAGPYADWPRFVDLIQRAESCGFDAYWMVDHPVRRPGCWTTLAGLAAVTRTIRLGTLVNCVLYRSAFEVARQAADVDRMSNGRVILGVGAGDDELECKQLGISMPPPKERVRLLGAMIQSVKDLWGEKNHRDTAGSRLQLQPGPVQSPRVPILIAGLGRSTLRHAAEYADAVNFPPTLTAGDAIRGATVQSLTRADVEQKLAILETHCTDLSRPLSSFVRSHMAPVVIAETPTRLADKLNGLPERTRSLAQLAIAGTPAQVTQSYESLMVGGINYFIVALFGNDAETLELLADRVWPALADSARSTGRVMSARSAEGSASDAAGRA